MEVISNICAVLVVLTTLAVPVLLTIFVIRWCMRKSKKWIGLSAAICASCVVPLILIGTFTDPATYCDHQYSIVEEISPTCTKRGKIVKACPLCESESIEYVGKVDHIWETDSVVSANCTKDGYMTERCSVCDYTQKTATESALGHDMEEISRKEPTQNEGGEIVKECSRCGKRETESIDKLPKPTEANPTTENTEPVSPTDVDPGTEPTGSVTDPTNGDDGKYVSGETITGAVTDIVDDGVCEKLVSFGFTEDEAASVREILLKCGISDISKAEATDASATIDGLIAFRWEMDDKRTVWFTVDRREVIYIGLNGVDVYDIDKGGFLINVNDVHVPESNVSLNTRHTLIDQTENVLTGYFVNALWYDAWGVARSDNKYMVQCEVYAQNKLGVKNWVTAKVWYEYDGSEYTVTAVVIDGKRYK